MSIGETVRRFRFFLRRDRLRRELGQEIRLHVDLRAAALRDAGADAEESQYAARRQFGNRALIADASRDVWGWIRLESLLHDVRYAARLLSQTPLTTACALLTLALGIGANTAIFTLVDALMLKNLPVAEPERLVQITIRRPDTPESQTAMSYPLFEELQRRAKSFSGIFCWTGSSYSLGWGVDARVISGAIASGDAYRTLGIQPEAGRLFTTDDDRDGAPLVAVISDAFWESEFHRDPGAIGRAIFLDGQPVVLLGVTPPSFRSVTVGNAPAITLPIHTRVRLRPESQMLKALGAWYLTVLARLRPGVSSQQAGAELRTISRGIMTDLAHPEWTDDDRTDFEANRFDLIPGATGDSWIRKSYGRALYVLMAICALVLLIACVNVANLMLARAAARRKEMCVRMALGASRRRLIRQLLLESTLLSCAGAAVGVLVAVWGVHGLLRLLSIRIAPMSLDLSPDLRVLAFMASVAIGSGLLFGIAPALEPARIQPNDVLKQARIGGRGGSRRSLLTGLIPLQVVLSVVLLAGAILFTRTMQNLKWQDLGFERSDIIFVSLDVDKSGLHGKQLGSYYTDLLTKIRALPFVRVASLTGIVPIAGSWQYSILSPDLWPDLKTSERSLYNHRVWPQYFRAMGLRLLQGRDFDAHDAANHEKLGILSESAARTYFGGSSPLGRLLRLDKDDVCRIIGVVEDAKYAQLRQPAPRTLYRLALGTGGASNLVIRAGVDRGTVVAAVRSLVRATGRDVAITDTVTLDGQIDRALTTERLIAVLATFFAILAAILVAIGLYGGVGYGVTRSTSEIGVRIALGAPRRNVVWMVLKRTLALVAAGIAVGVPVAVASGRLVAGMLFGVQPADAGVMVGASAAMVVIAAVAVYLPARRASRVDPAVALRYE